MGNNGRPVGSGGAVEGKGFYIVLFLCAAVVIASAWMLIAGAGTNVEDTETVSVDISDAVVTMLPAGTLSEPMLDIPVAAMDEDAPISEDEAADESAATAEETSVTYVWPVHGSVEVPYSVETLLYDATMADWRTHDGMDIACWQGDEVLAAADGTVVDVWNDDLLGSTIEIEHKNGVHSVYANLASEPPVSEGETVTMGQVIGSVGGTALGEVNEVPHLHFSMTVDGAHTDPANYLPDIVFEE